MVTTRPGDVVSIDPRTGRTDEVVAQETTTEEVDRLYAAALGAAPALEALGRAGRAGLRGLAVSYGRISDGLADSAEVEKVARGGEASGAGSRAVPRLLTTAAGDLPRAVTEQCFGPVSVVPLWRRGGTLRRAGPAAGVADRDGAARRRRDGAAVGGLRAATAARRPAGPRRLPDRRRGLVGPAPRPPLAVALVGSERALRFGTDVPVVAPERALGQPTDATRDPLP